MNKKRKKAQKFKTFDFLNYGGLILLSIIMVYPFINVIAVSISSYSSFVRNPLMIIPSELNLDAYKQILPHPTLWSSYLNTIIITVSGTLLGLVIYILTAYPLTKKHLKGRKFVLALVLFTMLFNGGIIPNFILIKNLGLYDSLAALVFPLLFSAFNLFIFINYMEGLPDSLEESAKIDGANDFQVLLHIITPLCKPIIATVALFSAVSYWNNFFLSIMYIKSIDKWPLMLFLREIIMGAKMSEIASGGNLAEVSQKAPSEILQYATLIIVMVPILCIYPFLQKYFVKGISLGAVKE